MRAIIIAAVGTMFVGSAALAADSHKIVLEAGKASVYNIEAHVGDTIEITHEDETDAKHDLYATDEAHTFDLTGMQHGDHYDFKVVEPGTFVIHCHAMEEMKITVNVQE
ncbi:hypothetical protein RDV64_16345 [Acuticoccus sp. MNP-M23]|uniref:cupredoxin domain-containing protein n=1 Tax=Acuticoccus sp. MNP-M23 TaxID=3072793 RepID=UPI002815364E|nr:hypothetical protein [Acuticoccus sp. MNP-M23]WMS41637.1 hypothetical protein RDV64_16345 [Acuticoccus sp. MNP-M23]